LDFDGAISRRYGAIPHDADPAKGNVPLRRIWVVLDPTLRILKVTPFRPDGGEAIELIHYLKSLPPPGRFAGFEVQAPVSGPAKRIRAGILREADRPV
jgi:hypothetical protein